MINCPKAVVAAVMLGGVALASAGASAMPMVDTSPAVMARSADGSAVQEAYFRRFVFHRHFGFRRHYGFRRGVFHRRFR